MARTQGSEGLLLIFQQHGAGFREVSQHPLAYVPIDSGTKKTTALVARRLLPDDACILIQQEVFQCSSLAFAPQQRLYETALKSLVSPLWVSLKLCEIWVKLDWPWPKA